jgi:hypothetical protein
MSLSGCQKGLDRVSFLALAHSRFASSVLVPERSIWALGCKARRGPRTPSSSTESFELGNRFHHFDRKRSNSAIGIRICRNALLGLMRPRLIKRRTVCLEMPPRYCAASGSFSAARVVLLVVCIPALKPTGTRSKFEIYTLYYRFIPLGHPRGLRGSESLCKWSQIVFLFGTGLLGKHVLISTAISRTYGNLFSFHFWLR